ncbi:KH domain-containing protein [Candidatus Microgenomates bacterium]|nr:MAG: KH domain-containing protein [Candidatus Microgenomates bacterium]
MKKTLQHIVSLIIDKPEDVKIEEKEENDMTNFTISVPKEEMGKVIGKEGKVIRAIRNVMRIPAIKQGKRINISLLEQPQE